MEVSSLYSSFTVSQPVISAPPSAVANSVDTVLPQGSQSVAPVGAGEATGGTGNGASGLPQPALPDQPGQAPTIAKFTRDPSTNALVFMAIDPQTQAVVMQFPDEQLLKLKSFIAEMQRREQAAHQSTPGAMITKTM
jgi:type II secretory pathway component GspD/PulD (secretin)